MRGDIEQVLRQFIGEAFLFSDSPWTEPSDTSLRDSGIIDSTGVTELICFLEQSFGIEVRDDEVVPENLDSVRGLKLYVSYKLGHQSLTSSAA
jgi:acyl carrier protein